MWLLLALNSLNEPPTVIGLSKDRNQFVIPNENSYNSIGRLNSYNFTEVLQFRVEVLGSNIKLFVNGVLIGQGQAIIMNSPI